MSWQNDNNLDLQAKEALRLEGVMTSVGFDDVLDVTLGFNHPHFDTLIVVTSHDDRKTQKVCQKHGVTCVQTDLFKKNGRNFNKGAAINAGFNYFQYHGWRMHLDCDIILPSNFKRVLFNHSTLHPANLYGFDRIDVIGKQGLKDFLPHYYGQHDGMKVSASFGAISHRWVDNLEGHLILGFAQLFHCSCQKPYPYSLGNAAHDDLIFSALWGKENRIHLPTLVLYHLVTETPYIGQNWENRRSKRLE